jgi:exopolysaccharide biosynthesis polyprenyl glycosylphosphotransferase
MFGEVRSGELATHALVSSDDALGGTDWPTEDVSARGLAPAASAARSNWRVRYQRVVVVSDLLAAVLGVCLVFLARFGGQAGALTPTQLGIAAALPGGWLACLAFNRAYEIQFLGAGTIEFVRIGHAFLHATVLTAFAAYVLKADLSRVFVMAALPLVLVLCLSGRYAARKVLHHRRRNGGATVPMLAVGSLAEIVRLRDTLLVNDYTGLRVVAACVIDSLDGTIGEPETSLEDCGITVLGDIDTVREAAATSGARSVAVVSRDISGDTLRWISWQLEGTELDMIVIPGLTEVAGRRLDIQQVGGLPLLHIAQPELTGPRRVLKAAFDRTAAAAALVVLAPIMLATTALIRLTSRGPALFVQTRVGKNGRTFRMVKFRSMRAGAELLVPELHEKNEFAGGTLFKMREDPRITRVGRVLRRYSLDELPQLFNVLAGSMSLVGPRPPLPSEVAGYGGEVRRRLLVKPGLTGLWQISGRSDLTWEESVRLDLRYVESWSLTLDLIVLLKTVSAVIRPRGAY